MFFIDGEKKYGCLSTHGYWCLPLSWTTGHEFIDVVITSIVRLHEDNGTYEVSVSTNSSQPYVISCVYKQRTTTTTTTSTTTVLYQMTTMKYTVSAIIQRRHKRILNGCSCSNFFYSSVFTYNKPKTFSISAK